MSEQSLQLLEDRQAEIEELTRKLDLAEGRLIQLGHHHCRCHWYRLNEGREATFFGGHGIPERREVVKPYGPCATCGSTGWCY